MRQQAKSLLGVELAKAEKFTTSLRDGIDVRETLRHSITSKSRNLEIYVKEIPPSRGTLEVILFLFEVPADSEKFSWQATWYAEHQEESTLCFYATPFLENMVGPGIGQSQYGGTMFLFPPRPIPDIWTDPQLELHENFGRATRRWSLPAFPGTPCCPYLSHSTQSTLATNCPTIWTVVDTHSTQPIFRSDG